jgi:hypothetical protein
MTHTKKNNNKKKEKKKKKKGKENYWTNRDRKRVNSGSSIDFFNFPLNYITLSPN